ncbi:unnamed protein product [Candida verbasci]|uniref:Mitochondrial adapter protein MCP1 transmembrane domain-containing protein n=1 Tax=Candida verbasci TaxID=1227364 RepID=A0A9W4XC90_9ASCO|nr:unnamed protein product [Candida verbasci]
MEHNNEELKKVNQIPLDHIEELDDENVKNRKAHDKRWLIPYSFKIQKYSAYTFLGFLGIHIASTIIIPIIPIANTYKSEIFSIAKEIYKLPLFEPIVIIGSSITHVLSGIALRYLKPRKRSNEIIITDDNDDIGFGGLSSIFGLGYKKSFTSKLFNMSPLQFSGYVIITFAIYHYYKFKYIPTSIEGDNSLINLDYITYVLNVKWPILNTTMLGGLVWSVAYHTVNGFFKLKKLYSKNWKRIGLAIVNLIGISGTISIYLFKKQKVDGGDFLGKVFISYLNSFRI